ncbi:hypothetical protein DUI87_09323 [Hirundo rustica rustica]|uniref:ribonuclease H n=1 Tax=Hirundo rustica rustica TaxID=333673 RepID=A0A3M0KLV9_HIRRU|nr:hypothetical protein DUI87_09323 [Hirundo rustica rustica]
MGERRWTDPTDQASSILIKALQTIREHAVTAFFSMVPDGPVIPYYKIVQGTKEAFTKFVEQLTRAIEVQVSEVAVREGILREMVFANVNNLCRTAILSLPLDPPPTIQDMLQVCQLKVPYMQGNDRDAKSPTPRVAAISGTQQEHIHRPNLCLEGISWLNGGVKIDIPDPSVDISTATIEERPTKKLNWLTDNPVWVEQWPLSKQKLKALEELVEEQLRKGHIVETDSPWNSPVFVIQKPGKDKWRLLQDVRQINNVIEDMGSLQPGMPSPTMLPENWKLAIIDIKDCFFQIPLHPDDAPRFAFSVPTINREAPRKRYHWWVLPQGMKNSPVICQWYVASLLSPVRAAAGQAIIHHYMDDVLVCAPTDDVLTHALDLTINALIAAGFELQEEKVQRMPPWKYLGLEIGKQTIVPQKLAIKTKWKDIPKKDRDGKDPLSIIEWVFLSHQRSKRMTRPQELVAELIRKARGGAWIGPRLLESTVNEGVWSWEFYHLLEYPGIRSFFAILLDFGHLSFQNQDSGDRAWAGIPPRHLGGPCTLGKLGLFSPNKTTLANWQRKISSDSAVQKRDLKAVDPDCDSKIVHWTKSKGVAIAIFLLWVAIAKALGELAHLECWVAKQANLTSEALSNLLSEEEITRQATLQNRAAIDYLLLLHGHRCEEFEGLCCFNLTSKAEDVHATIQKMREMVGNIKRETEDWLSGLFANWGISSWDSSIIKTVLLCLFILLLIMLAFGLLKRILYNLISATTHSPSVNHIIVPTEESSEEEGLKLEEVLEGAPEDDGEDPDEEEHGLGYPTQHH